jgi:hypothetical protein
MDKIREIELERYVMRNDNEESDSGTINKAMMLRVSAYPES